MEEVLRQTKVKFRDIPLRKRECASKDKTIRLKAYLKEKSNKSRRKNVKISHKKEIKHNLFASNINLNDDNLYDDIEIQYMQKYIEYEDALMERYYEFWNHSLYVCDHCHKFCPGNIKFDFSKDIKCCKTCHTSLFYKPWNKRINHRDYGIIYKKYLENKEYFI